MGDKSFSITIQKTNVHYISVLKQKSVTVLFSFNYEGSTHEYDNPLSQAAGTGKVVESLLFKAFAETIKSVCLYSMTTAINNGITGVNYSLGNGNGNISVQCKPNLAAVSKVISLVTGSASTSSLMSNFKYYAMPLKDQLKVKPDEVKSKAENLLSFSGLNILIAGTLKKATSKLLSEKLSPKLKDVCSKEDKSSGNNNALSSPLEASIVGKTKKLALFPEGNTYVTTGNVDVTSDKIDNEVKKLVKMAERYGSNVLIMFAANSASNDAASLAKLQDSIKANKSDITSLFKRK